MQLLVWAYYAHGRWRRCREDHVRLPSGGLEVMSGTRSSPYQVAQHLPTGSETTPPYAPRSSRFGWELPSVEDDVDLWRYAILELHARNDDDELLVDLYSLLSVVALSLLYLKWQKLAFIKTKMPPSILFKKSRFPRQPLGTPIFKLGKRSKIWEKLTTPPYQKAAHRGHTILHVIENFAKSLDVTQGHSKLHRCVGHV